MNDDGRLRFRDWFFFGAVLGMLVAIVRWPAGVACAGCLAVLLVIFPVVLIAVLIATNIQWFVLLSLAVAVLWALVLVRRG